MTESEGRIIKGLDILADFLREQNDLLRQIAASLKPATKKKREVAPLGSAVWDCYRLQYEARYKVQPVRNAKTNSLCAQLAQRLGEEAPEVAAFYVQKHNDRLYLSARHALDLLVRDAEKIRTDWKRGAPLTQKDAANGESLAYARTQMDRIARGEL